MKTKDKIIFFFTNYVYGLVIGFTFYFFKFLGNLKVIHEERFPWRQKNMIILSNHPSLLEPFLLPGIMFPQYFLRPLDDGPISTPDDKNFFHWFFIKPWSVSIDRNDPIKRIAALKKMIRLLKNGKIIVIFAEGGRTEGGETVQGHTFLYSKNGKKIRKLEEGAAFLALNANSVILPIWIDGAKKILPNTHTFIIPRFWRPLTIKIGKLFKFEEKISRKKATVILQNILLALADEKIT